MSSNNWHWAKNSKTKVLVSALVCFLKTNKWVHINHHDKPIPVLECKLHPSVITITLFIDQKHSLGSLVYYVEYPQTHYHKHVASPEHQSHLYQWQGWLDQKPVLSYGVASSRQICGAPVIGEHHVELKNGRTSLRSQYWCQCIPVPQPI